MEINYKIDLPSKSEWYMYYAEYKYFVQISFERLEGGEITSISLPLAFCIRHTLELGYKMNILELQKVSDLKSNLKYTGKSAHKIDTLHRDFVLQVKAIFTKYAIDKSIVTQFNNLNNEMVQLKTIIHKLDEFSYSFRYPVANDGVTPNFKMEDDLKDNKSINFKEIKQLYDQSIVLLTYTTDVISEKLNN